MALQSAVMAPPAVIPQSTASIYVGDLLPDVTEGQLAEIFSEFKTITSVRLCRDSTTGRSLCYGYVNFVSHQDAVRAIETKNNFALHGKAIRVMWSQRDSDARKVGVGNVFVKNLVDSIDNAGLKDIFLEFGEIISTKVAVFPDGRSKGYGFVQFESQKSAEAAIEKLTGSTVGEKQIYVGKFIRKSERILNGLDSKYTNLYVKNLDSDVTEELLQKKFSEFGKIVSLVIAKDENGASKGFGFINFENPDDARRALDSMNGLDLGSKILYVARAQKKAEREQILRHQFEEKRKEKILAFQGLNVYVKNIDDDVTDEELKEHFGQCGTITSAKLMRDDKGVCKGFGFVCFSSNDEATKAVNTLHGHMFHTKPLYVAIAQRKEDRQAQLQLQFAQHMAGLAGTSATIIPPAYPPLYYNASGVVSQVPRPGMIYQPMGMRPGWRGNGFARPGFQPSPFPAVFNGPRHQRQNRGRVNGQLHSQGGPHSGTYLPHLMQPPQTANSSKDSSNQQHIGQVTYVTNGHTREVNIGSAIQAGGTDSVGTASREAFSSMLAAASPDHQKQILGERLYPLVFEHKPDLVAKITGMLLEMDNSELLLLLESPESLSAKVEEAVQVLKLSKTKASGQDSLHSSYLSAEVAVN